MSEDSLELLNAEDRQRARELKQQGWLPTKACVPAVRAIGPWLPPPESDDAALLFGKWATRLGTDSCQRFEGLEGLCDHPVDIEAPADGSQQAVQSPADLHFIMHSPSGTEHGHHGQFSMSGLARVFAQLHLKTLCFVHFFSGYRREGDIQHQIDNHIIQGHFHLFCISVDFCLQGDTGDLATGSSRAFWTNKIKSGAVCGVGGARRARRTPLLVFSTAAPPRCDPLMNQMAFPPIAPDSGSRHFLVLH